MYKLKLYNNWEKKLEERINEEKRNNRFAKGDEKVLLKNYTNVTKKIKEIDKLISQADIIEENKDYTIYGIGW